MKFGNDQKVIFTTLNKVEASAFISFLREEWNRHWLAIVDAEKEIPLKPIEAPFWKSAVKRHQEDLESIDRLISEVSHWFKLDE